jgi:RNA polymerase sigma factor (sigma-70 family)
VRLDGAFPRDLADEGRAILWRDLGCDPNDAATWTRPVIRLGQYAQEPFVRAANTPILHDVFDRLVGAGRWLPRWSLGTFPVRFPSPDDPGDAGWHIDVSFPGRDSDPNDFLSWRANVASRGRVLLMLFLFSDVGEDDAPPRLRVRSHRDIARVLAPAGEEGLSLRELAATDGFAGAAGRPEVLATGAAGTVYLCHPFRHEARLSAVFAGLRASVRPLVYPRFRRVGSEVCNNSASRETPPPSRRTRRRRPRAAGVMRRLRNEARRIGTRRFEHVSKRRCRGCAMDGGMSARVADRAQSPALPSGGGGSAFDFDRELVASLPRLRVQALALTQNRADADDLVQDAARNALAARCSFAPGTDMAAWLYRILRNRFVSILRRAREVTGREDDLAAAAPAARGAQEDALVLGELRRALGRLPAEQRVALVVVVAQGMRYAELAAAAGCAVGTAKSRVCRVRDALHAMLPGPNAAPRRRSTSVPRAVGAARLPPRDGTLFDHGGGAP